MRHTISALVENKPGVLARCAGLFARRGFNIDSLAVSTTESPDVSRMIITVSGDEQTLDQICKQLQKLVDVIAVLDHTGDATVERELCLCKINVRREDRSEVIELCSIFRAEVVDIGENALMIEVTGDEEKIDAFVNVIKDYEIDEMVRTGKILLVRGSQPT